MSCCRSNKPPSDDSGSSGNAVNTCKECVEFLIDYLDGTLPAARRAEFELHLALCPPCHRYLHQYQATIRLGQAAMEKHAATNPPPEALVRAILAAMKSPTNAHTTGLATGSNAPSNAPSTGAPTDTKGANDRKAGGDCGCSCNC
jgi:anti-sigma factor RsiW